MRQFQSQSQQEITDISSLEHYFNVGNNCAIGSEMQCYLVIDVKICISAKIIAIILH